jgi:hypothetical protein
MRNSNGHFTEKKIKLIVTGFIFWNAKTITKIETTIAIARLTVKKSLILSIITPPFMKILTYFQSLYNYQNYSK